MSTATRFVAGFIGSPAMNFFKARVSGGGQSVQFPNTESFPIFPYVDPSFRDKEVTLGIRPEHFNLTEDGTGMIHIRVDHVETLGADTLVHGHSGENHTFFTLRLPDIHRFRKGTSLPLDVSSEKLHLLTRRAEKE